MDAGWSEKADEFRDGYVQRESHWVVVIQATSKHQGWDVIRSAGGEVTADVSRASLELLKLLDEFGNFFLR